MDGAQLDLYGRILYYYRSRRGFQCTTYLLGSLSFLTCANFDIVFDAHGLEPSPIPMANEIEN